MTDGSSTAGAVSARTGSDVLLQLARRCETEEPSRELDVDIQCYLREGAPMAERRKECMRAGYEPMEEVWPKFTTSLDAAVGLVEDEDWGVHWDVEGVHRGACLYVWTDHPTAEHTFRRSPLCKTRKEALSHLPRLICAAALRARAALQRNPEA